MSKNFFLYAMVGLILAGFVFSPTKASGPKQKSEQYAEPVKSLDGFLGRTPALMLYSTKPGI